MEEQAVPSTTSTIGNAVVAIDDQQTMLQLQATTVTTQQQHPSQLKMLPPTTNQNSETHSNTLAYRNTSKNASSSSTSTTAMDGVTSATQEDGTAAQQATTAATTTNTTSQNHHQAIVAHMQDHKHHKDSIPNNNNNDNNNAQHHHHHDSQQQQPVIDTSMSSQQLSTNTTETMMMMSSLPPLITTTTSTTAASTMTISSSTSTTREMVLKRLSSALQKRTLTKIDLSQKGLTVKDAYLVQKAILQNDHVSILKLGYNLLEDQGVEILSYAVAQHQNLQSLDLGFNQIGNVGMKALAQALETSPRLQTLYLPGNLISQEGAFCLAKLLRSNKCPLQRLYMNGNKLGPDGVTALMQAMKQDSHHITELFLGGTAMGIQGCQAVADYLSHNKKSMSSMSSSTSKHLRVLSLANCDITDDLMISLSDSLDYLESIQLSFNSITYKGLERFVNALLSSSSSTTTTTSSTAATAANTKTSVLKELRLDNNQIGDRGAQQLAAVLAHLPTLEILDVGFNQIQSLGLMTLLKALASSSSSSNTTTSSSSNTTTSSSTPTTSKSAAQSIQSLSISGNSLDTSAAKAVAYALAYNTSLQSLFLVHCKLSPEGQRHIAAGLVSNSSISLREFKGFSLGSVVVSLGFPSALEHWTNEQVLNFVHLMWEKRQSSPTSNGAGGLTPAALQEELVDPLHFLPETNPTRMMDAGTTSNNNGQKQYNQQRPTGPVEASAVVALARRTYDALVKDGVDVFSRQPGYPTYNKTTRMSTSITPLEHREGENNGRKIAGRDWGVMNSFVSAFDSRTNMAAGEERDEVMMDSTSSPVEEENGAVSKHPSLANKNGTTMDKMKTSMTTTSTAAVQSQHWKGASKGSQEPQQQQQQPSTSRKKRIVEWLCSNIQHLNQMCQKPFDSNELSRLHQHYFAEVLSDGSGGTFSKSSFLQQQQQPPPLAQDVQGNTIPSQALLSYSKNGGGTSSTATATTTTTTAKTRDEKSTLPTPATRNDNTGTLQEKQPSLPMLKRKISYRFLGDANMIADGGTSNMIEGGSGAAAAAEAKLLSSSGSNPNGQSSSGLTPPQSKRARRNRSRISFLPRIKSKLDSNLEVCQEKALVLMRQLRYVEVAILNGQVNPIGGGVGTSTSTMEGNSNGSVQRTISNIIPSTGVAVVASSKTSFSNPAATSKAKVDSALFLSGNMALDAETIIVDMIK